MTAKWSRTYFTDLAERTVATFLGALVTMLTADSSGVVSGSAQQWWLIVGLPTVLALIKGLLANLAAPESGPSALPSPPAPDMDTDYEPRHRGEDGASDVVTILAVVVLVLVILALVGLI